MAVSMKAPRPFNIAPAPDSRIVHVDFTGGLNLFLDGTQLDMTQSSDLLNVDPLVGGGFARRRIVAPFGVYRLPSKAEALSTYIDAAGAQWMLPSIAGNIYKLAPPAKVPADSLITADTPIAGTHFLAAGSSTSIWRIVQAYHKAYLYDSTGQETTVRSYDGTTVTAKAATTWNAAVPKYSAYTSLTVPTGRAMAMWHGRLWVANTLEGGTRYENRIRFSFPIVNNVGAEDWHADDYITIDENGTEIIALVPTVNHLYVFKRHGIHVISGFDETDFRQDSVTTRVGAVSADAITVMGQTVFFWDARSGLRALTPGDGTGDNAQSVLDDGTISGKIMPLVREDVLLDSLFVGTVGERVWVTCTLPDGRRTLVWDPLLGGGQGGWTVYDLDVGPYSSYWRSGLYGSNTPSGTAMDYVAGLRDPLLPSRLLVLEQEGDVDNFGSAFRSVSSWFRTGWMTDNKPFDSKRWTRMELVLQAGDGQSFTADIYSEWDRDTIRDSLGFNSADLVDGNFVLDLSPMAPTMLELKRPLGTAWPGANLLYTPSPIAPYQATWNDPVVTWNSSEFTWGGSPVTAEASTGSDLYVPVSRTPEPCQEATPGYPTLARSTDRTGYEHGPLVLPRCRALQVRFSGALPSKRWAVRGIMMRYRTVKE